MKLLKKPKTLMLVAALYAVTLVSPAMAQTRSSRSVSQIQQLADSAASFHPNGDQLWMYGVIDGNTQNKLRQIMSLGQYRTLVLHVVPGSDDDDANLSLCRAVRQFGLNTMVPFDGQVYSGGVDLFIAGKQRNAENGAKLGVHPWRDEFGNPGRSGDKNRYDPDHAKFINYYEEMLGTDHSAHGRSMAELFYWFTLNATPNLAGSDMHVMSREEMQQFGIVSTETNTAVNGLNSTSIEISNQLDFPVVIRIQKAGRAFQETLHIAAKHRKILDQGYEFAGLDAASQPSVGQFKVVRAEPNMIQFLPANPTQPKQGQSPDIVNRTGRVVVGKINGQSVLRLEAGQRMTGIQNVSLMVFEIVGANMKVVTRLDDRGILELHALTAQKPVRDLPLGGFVMEGAWNEIRNDGRNISITIESDGRFRQYESGRSPATGRISMTESGEIQISFDDDGSTERYGFTMTQSRVTFYQNGQLVSRFHWQRQE